MSSSKNKKNSKNAFLLLSSVVTAVGGVVLWMLGNPTEYTPMNMSALFLLMIAFLLAANTLLPMLYKLLGRLTEKEGIKRVPTAIFGGILKAKNIISLVVSIVIIAVYGYIISLHAFYVAPKITVSYLHLFAFVMAFIVSMVMSKVSKHYVEDANASATISSIFAFLKVDFLLLSMCCALNVTAVADVNTYARIGEGILIVYAALFLLISLIKALIKKDLTESPRLVIPSPVSKENSEDDLISYLEQSTGLTLRSLFSIKYAGSILPGAILVCALLIWLSTGIVQIDAYEKGAHYRLGRLDGVLEPGIHLTLPYPFDKVDVYNTETIRETVVGYDSNSGGNILWTQSHGGTEYKLLIGDGYELVSVNIRVQYKIDDLYEYVTVASEADKILNAQAYSVITALTVESDLDTIISLDRAQLSETIEKEINGYFDKNPCGVAVLDVIIESIHPPVEVADIYQQMISAEIEAQAKIVEAQGMAGSNIAYAETAKIASVKQALADQYERVGEANASVAEFMGMVQAYEEYPDEFKYYKYMDALRNVFSNQRLYILGEGVDERYIYFGSDVLIYN